MLQNNRLIRITTGTSRKATAWVGQELYWSDFVQRLSQPVRTQESLGQYKSLTRTGRPEGHRRVCRGHAERAAPQKRERRGARPYHAGCGHH